MQKTLSGSFFNSVCIDRAMHKNQLTGRSASPGRLRKNSIRSMEDDLWAEARTDSAGLYAALKRRSSTVLHACCFS
jgi:hypothetical protein